ncbi:MAG: hypothetical protein WA397_26275 [Roseiarcus sp.]
MNDDSDTLRRLAESQYNQEFDKAADFIAACAAATALSQFRADPHGASREELGVEAIHEMADRIRDKALSELSGRLRILLGSNRPPLH